MMQSTTHEQNDRHVLPKGWVWTTIGEVALLNPNHSAAGIPGDTEVSFLPMKSVEEQTGRINLSSTKKYAEARRGYSTFADGDIIFAKITPCMENGKIAVVDHLKNGVGCGSTEFHVIRPVKGIVSAKLILFHLFRQGFREQAQKQMTGSAGQLRVPVKFLESTSIPIPPKSEGTDEAVSTGGAESRFRRKADGGMAEGAQRATGTCIRAAGANQRRAQEGFGEKIQGTAAS